MSLYAVSIEEAPKGTHTKVKKVLSDFLGGTAGWDYDKPHFEFSADDDQIVLISLALGELDLSVVPVTSSALVPAEEESEEAELPPEEEREETEPYYEVSAEFCAETAEADGCPACGHVGPLRWIGPTSVMCRKCDYRWP